MDKAEMFEVRDRETETVESNDKTVMFYCFSYIRDSIFNDTEFMR